MKSQSKASKGWAERTGRVSKTYKLAKGVVDDFAEACEENEATQSEILTLLMQAYTNGFVYYTKTKKKAAIFLPNKI
jgi:hypothetical protein